MNDGVISRLAEDISVSVNICWICSKSANHSDHVGRDDRESTVSTATILVPRDARPVQVRAGVQSLTQFQSHLIDSLHLKVARL